MALTWSLVLNIARTDESTDGFTAIQDSGGFRVDNGTEEDFASITTLPELNDFLTVIGYGTPTPGVIDPTVADFSFRFGATTTTGETISVLGGSKELGTEVITDDLDAALAELNGDSDFVGFLLGATPTVVSSNTGISFATIIGDDSITSSTGTEFLGLVGGNTLRVTGSNSNDADFTVSSVALGGARVIVVESVTTEAAGAAITIVKL